MNLSIIQAIGYVTLYVGWYHGEVDCFMCCDVGVYLGYRGRPIYIREFSTASRYSGVGVSGGRYKSDIAVSCRGFGYLELKYVAEVRYL